MSMFSILYPVDGGSSASAGAMDTPAYFHDLSLDHIEEAVASQWPDLDLASIFRRPLMSPETVIYRQQVMQDLEDTRTRDVITGFTQGMRSVRETLAISEKTGYRYEREFWLIQAAQLYCDTVQRAEAELKACRLTSQGMLAWSAHLTKYVQSQLYRALTSEVQRIRGLLASVRYRLLLNDGSITVRPWENEPDLTDVLEQTLSKFRDDVEKSFLAEFHIPRTLNHIEAQVLLRVARIYPEPFSALETFPMDYAPFLDEVIVQVDRDIRFYLAYLNCIQPLRQAGIPFCYPVVSNVSKHEDVHDTCDLALALRLVAQGNTVVLNSYHLKGCERLFIVTGPNQGGKTTFARMFGQIHHLASLGCPVPGTAAQLHLFDQLFTHFDREEDVTRSRGRLQDELLRIHNTLQQASSHSIVIMNELFASTTTDDALFLSQRVLSALCDLDLLGVFVTFLTELASFHEKVVSVVGLMDDSNPPMRTFKLERRLPDGRAHALMLARKHRVTYDSLMERIQP